MAAETLTETVTEHKQTDQTAILVKGHPLPCLPEHLYIPHNPLSVFLEGFSGPLDLLLYLIKKQNISILDIPIAKITEQYMQYVELMRQLDLALISDYLVMSAMLANIKSRELLPEHPVFEEEQEDPRAELLRCLQQYEMFKAAADTLDQIPRVDREYFLCQLSPPSFTHPERIEPDVKLEELVLAMQAILMQVRLKSHHKVCTKPLSIREKMLCLLNTLSKQTAAMPFTHLFVLKEGRAGVVVTFLALLALVQQTAIKLVQKESFGPIYIRYVRPSS